ncbi:MAG: parallel beta-helix domain-containing protein [Oceanicaulis sp.]
MALITRVMAAIAVFAICACAAEEARDTTGFDREYQHTLTTALLDAQPGDVIEIPAGTFLIERGLSLTVDNVTIRGQGMDATILSFAEQRQGAEGLLVSGADDFTIENLAIEDTVGDALKITDGDNVVIRGVRVEWTNGPSIENGAYGLYPVQSTDVLIEDSVAIGASDAGIYVGQSDRIVVRNNRAEYNVAGIEIENSNHADVYGNVATNNTGGILVFNMPHLPRPGAGTRVYDNDVFENNTGNFGHAGTPVASVPAGTGILVNSNDDVQIFNNRLRDNRTGHVIISSFYSSGFENLSLAEDFNPYPEGIWVYDNTYEGGGGNPDALMLQAARVALFGPMGALPPVIWDGYTDAAYAEGLPEDKRICVNDAEVVWVHDPRGVEEPRHGTEPFDCTLAPLAPVTLEL